MNSPLQVHLDLMRNAGKGTDDIGENGQPVTEKQVLACAYSLMHLNGCDLVGWYASCSDFLNLFPTKPGRKGPEVLRLDWDNGVVDNINKGKITGQSGVTVNWDVRALVDRAAEQQEPLLIFDIRKKYHERVHRQVHENHTKFLASNKIEVLAKEVVEAAVIYFRAERVARDTIHIQADHKQPNQPCPVHVRDKVDVSSVVDAICIMWACPGYLGHHQADIKDRVRKAQILCTILHFVIKFDCLNEKYRKEWFWVTDKLLELLNKAPEDSGDDPGAPVPAPQPPHPPRSPVPALVKLRMASPEPSPRIKAEMPEDY